MQPADIVAIILALAALIGCVNHLWIRLPPAIAMLGGSLALSLMIALSDHVLHLHVMSWFRSTLDSANLPHRFLDGALALLLFAASLHVDLTELKQRRWMILLLATASVFIATAAFGAGIHVMFGLVGMAVPLAWCLVLGAILAPTDAVVVEDLLRRIKLPAALRGAIVGESLFNDGAGVVLFLIALKITQDNSITFGHGEIIVPLAREIAGGAVLGFCAGWLATRLIGRIKDDWLQLLISLALAFVCYRLANRLELSGPIAVVTAGLLMGEQTLRTTGQGANSSLMGFWALLGQLLNAMLFLLMGLQVLGLMVDPAELLPVIVALPLAVVSRLVSVAIPILLNRESLREKVRGVTVLTWAGLRGGISVALALTLPPSPWRGDLLVVTYAVVVFTIVVQGLSMPWLLRKMYGAADGLIDQAPAR
jgi:CPA1 family monovalent cation:H+ antiporter